MITKRYTLGFSSPLHVSSGGFGLEQTDVFIASDTLFSAVCATANLLYGDETVNHFLKDGEVILSSAFPYQADTYLLPKPLNLRLKEGLAYEEEKVFKKIKFIAENALQNLDIAFGVDKNWFDMQGTLGKLFEIREVPRVTLDRVTQESTLFYFAEVHFQENTGLYFIAQFKTEQIAKQFEASLRLLGDEGIGGDRSVGKGQFRVSKVEDYTLNQKSSERYLCLSLFNPTKSDLASIDLQKSAYDLTQRNGWVSLSAAASLRRKTVRAFTEGSVFRATQVPKGTICPVLKVEGTDYTIYRNLQALFLPL